MPLIILLLVERIYTRSLLPDLGMKYMENGGECNSGLHQLHDSFLLTKDFVAVNWVALKTELLLVHIDQSAEIVVKTLLEPGPFFQFSSCLF
jgi:hypothetical protein